VAKPAPVDIDVVRGDSYDLYIGVKRAGVRIDLTGATVTGQVRATVDDAAVAATFNCVLSDQVADTGGVLCSLSKAETATFAFSKGVYDIQVDFSNGIDRTTVVGGAVNVVKDVTRNA
jgi:hypothetical protein